MPRVSKDAVQRGDQPQARADLEVCRTRRPRRDSERTDPSSACSADSPRSGTTSPASGRSAAPWTTSLPMLSPRWSCGREARCRILHAARRPDLDRGHRVAQSAVSAGADGFAAADAELAAVDSAGFVALAAHAVQRSAPDHSSRASPLGGRHRGEILPGMLGEDGARVPLGGAEAMPRSVPPEDFPGRSRCWRPDRARSGSRSRWPAVPSGAEAADPPAHQGRAVPLRPAARHLLRRRQLHARLPTCCTAVAARWERDIGDKIDGSSRSTR